MDTAAQSAHDNRETNAAVHGRKSQRHATPRTRVMNSHAHAHERTSAMQRPRTHSHTHIQLRTGSTRAQHCHATRHNKTQPWCQRTHSFVCGCSGGSSGKLSIRSRRSSSATCSITLYLHHHHNQQQANIQTENQDQNEHPKCISEHKKTDKMNTMSSSTLTSTPSTNGRPHTPTHTAPHT